MTTVARRFRTIDAPMRMDSTQKMQAAVAGLCRCASPAPVRRRATDSRVADSADAVRAAISAGTSYDVDLRSPAIDGIIANQRRRSEEAKRIRAMNAAHQAKWADEAERAEAGR